MRPRHSGLVSAYLDGTISEGERRELLELISSDETVAMDLLEHVRVHREIELVLGHDARYEQRAHERILYFLQSCLDGPQFLVRFRAWQEAQCRAGRAGGPTGRTRTSTRRRITSIQRAVRAGTGGAWRLTMLLGVAAALMVAAALVFYYTPPTTRRYADAPIPPHVVSVRTLHRGALEGADEPEPDEHHERIPVIPSVEPSPPVAERAAERSTGRTAEARASVPSVIEPPAAPAASIGEKIAYIDIAEGPVECARRGGEWSEALAGLGIERGDSLKTAGARAVVYYETGTTLALNRFTTVRFFDGTGRQGVFVSKGEVCIQTSKEDSGFVVDTPHGRAVDRGTVFNLLVGPVTGTNVVVAEGTIEAATDLGTVRVEAAREVDLGSRVGLPGTVRYVPNLESRFAWTFAIPGYAELQKRSRLARGLVAYWRFDEGRGLLAYDSSGNRLAGRVFGPLWEYGRIGNALNFQKQTDVVLAGSPDRAILRGDLSICMWIRSNEPIPGTGRCLLSMGGPRPVTCLVLISGARLDFHFTDADDELQRLCVERGGRRLVHGTWYHLVVTYSDAADRVRAFVNGTLDREKPTRGVMPTITGPIIIGRSLWNGRIDDVRIYSRELSETDVKELYGEIEAR